MHGLHVAEMYRVGAVFMLLTLYVYLHSTWHSDLRQEAAFVKLVDYGGRSFKQASKQFR